MTNAERYCREFLGPVFYFCLRKTGREQDAEELSSRIGEEVLAALHRGAQPANFPAWVWQIARNQFSRFARTEYYAPDADRADIDECEFLLPAETDVEAELIGKEDLALLRRELSFIRSDYRRILVAHYFEEKSVSTIARELNIPLGTVKTRLQNSRKVLKEGMNMAREFGKRSYNPEEITFVNSCSNFGENGQPWTVLNHLLYKNIFLECYDNPSTAEQLSLELGIALPYMESELEFLVQETFLTKTDGYYEPTFPILSREAQRRIHDRHLADTAALTEKLTALIDRLAAECEKAGADLYGRFVSYETAKWALLMRTYDRLYKDAAKEILPPKQPYTKRPNGGEWDIVGYQSTDWPEPPFVGQHGNGCGGSAEHFSQYKFNYKKIGNRTPSYISEEEGEALAHLARGDAAKCTVGALDALAGYGYAARDGDKTVPAVAVFAEKNPEARLPEAARAELAAMAEEIREILRGQCRLALDVVRADLPKRICQQLRGDFVDVQHRGYVLEKALENGWITYTDDLPKGTGAYLIL